MYTHSIMFHHFHNKKHKKSQGSLSNIDFEKVINWLEINFNLLSADLYYEKHLKGDLKNEDICLSFDDGLLCQFDIALPILKKKKIKSFFFIYTSIFSENPDFLEIYRYFRTNYYSKIDSFYNDFFKVVKQENQFKYNHQKKNFVESNYLSCYPFYSKNDKWFRFIRDVCLNKKEYERIMKNLMLSKECNVRELKKNLWMTKKNIKEIYKLGHIVGLHSHTHPTKMSKLTKKEQTNEFKMNLTFLENLLGEKSIFSMSHPCGDYNNHTLNILSKMNIKIGFNSNAMNLNKRSSLEFPREDHANIIERMRI